MSSKEQKGVPNKRKREPSDTSQEPPKKKISIKLLQNDESKTCGPFLVEFPHNPPPPNVLTNGSSERASIACFSSESNGFIQMESQRKLVAETETILWEATAEPQDGIIYYMGIYNTKTQLMELVPVSQVFRMSQEVKSFVDLAPETTAFTLNETSLLTGKRQQKRMLQRRENYIKEENLLGLDQHVANQMEEFKKKLDTEPPLREDLPWYDKKTATVSKIYPVHFIVSEQELNTMEDKDQFYNIISSNPEELEQKIPSSTPTFTTLMLKKLANELDSEETTKQTCRLLQWLTYMIQFYLGASQKKQSKFINWKYYQELGLTPDVLEQIVLRFAEAQPGLETRKYRRTNEMNLKLIRHICILALTISGDFTIRPKVLAQDLQMMFPDMMAHFRSVGCKIVMRPAIDKDKKYAVAVLHAPLKFPMKKVKRNRSKSFK